jgi:hypothetical protein
MKKKEMNKKNWRFIKGMAFIFVIMTQRIFLFALNLPFLSVMINASFLSLSVFFAYVLTTMLYIPSFLVFLIIVILIISRSIILVHDWSENNFSELERWRVFLLYYPPINLI